MRCRPAVQHQLAQAARRDPVRQAEAAGEQQDRDRQPSTDEDVLQELAADHPLPKLLLEHRALSKLKSTYTDKLPPMVNPRTGPRAHDVQPGDGGDRTARVDGSQPAEHPGAHRGGPAHPRGFIAPPGTSIVSADYSQIELRIMAHLSGGPGARRGVPRRRGHPPRDRRRDLRRAARRGDGRAAALRQGGELRADLRHGRVRPRAAARHRAQRRAAVHRALFPALSGRGRVHADARASAREHGYVETLFGRRRWLPDIRRRAGSGAQAAERAAINAPMQGTAADLSSSR